MSYSSWCMGPWYRRRQVVYQTLVKAQISHGIFSFLNVLSDKQRRWLQTLQSFWFVKWGWLHYYVLSDMAYCHTRACSCPEKWQDEDDNWQNQGVLSCCWWILQLERSHSGLFKARIKCNWQTCRGVDVPATNCDVGQCCLCMTCTCMCRSRQITVAVRQS